MSDLTRRVLAIVQTDPVVTVCTVPDNDVATLARQVEAVEELADRLDAEAERLGPRGGGFTARAFAAEIRDALTDATKETSNE